jgi:plastocyanin
VDVTETEFELDPQNPRIAKPGVVQFDVTNAGKAPHALEVEGPEGEVETETIQPGGKATLKANLSRAGTYTWYCPVGNHEQQGMKGKITVGGGGAGTTTSGSRTDDSDTRSGRDDRSGGEDDRPGDDDRGGSGSGSGSGGGGREDSGRGSGGGVGGY